MRTVINNIQEITIKKSKFITLICQINNINEINDKLENIKKEYKDATHYCYAYIIDNNIKASDDGEPSGTAGIPILNVLKKEKLNHVLCVVVRYFGGTKLGAGGLLRAYSKSTKSTLKIVNLNEYISIEITFKIDRLKEIDSLLRNVEIKKIFGTSISYKFDIDKEKYTLIKNQLNLIGDTKETGVTYK